MGIICHLFKVYHTSSTILQQLQDKYEEQVGGKIVYGSTFTNEDLEFEIYMLCVNVKEGFFKKKYSSKIKLVGSKGMDKSQIMFTKKIFEVEERDEDFYLCELTEKEFREYSLLMMEYINEKVKKTLEWYKEKFNEDIKGEWEY